jgi:hypothetical protein
MSPFDAEAAIFEWRLKGDTWRSLYFAAIRNLFHEICIARGIGFPAQLHG